MLLRVQFAIALLAFVLIGAEDIQAALVTRCAVQDLAGSADTVWLLCAEGRVAVTTDSGNTWTEFEVGAKSLRGIGMLDKHRVFVAGDNGTLLASRDGGTNWDRISVPTSEHLTSVSFFGEVGWATGWGGVVLHSSDHGETWTLKDTGISQALESIDFVDEAHGWAVGWVGTIIRTTDGGNTWHTVSSDEALWSLNALYFHDENNGWAVGFMGQILRTRDGGKTWDSIPSPVESWLTSIFFDGQRGWIAAEDTLLVTEDGGENWNRVPVGERVSITRITKLEDDLVAASYRGLLQVSEGTEMLDEPRRLFEFGEEQPT